MALTLNVKVSVLTCLLLIQLWPLVPILVTGLPQLSPPTWCPSSEDSPSALLLFAWSLLEACLICQALKNWNSLLLSFRCPLPSLLFKTLPCLWTQAGGQSPAIPWQASMILTLSTTCSWVLSLPFAASLLWSPSLPSPMPSDCLMTTCSRRLYPSDSILHLFKWPASKTTSGPNFLFIISLYL